MASWLLDDVVAWTRLVVELFGDIEAACNLSLKIVYIGLFVPATLCMPPI